MQMCGLFYCKSLLPFTGEWKAMRIRGGPNGMKVEAFRKLKRLKGLQGYNFI